MKHGAFHYIPKPFKNEEVVLTVNKALEQRRLSRENERLKAELSEKYAYANIIGKTEPMRKVYELIRLAAPSRSNILVAGESRHRQGAGGESDPSRTRARATAFVTVNSGSLPPELLESSLFGHMKGAFTGAIATKRGLFEVADGGSIFLDEIGNINLETQAKLLRVIQEKEFMRLGGVETIKVDVRIIAATNADLEKLMAAGRFREDLYYRLNVITIPLPPLRRRREDIPLLVAHFLEKYARGEQEGDARDHAATRCEILLDYPWPGNVRELENTIERAVVLCTGDRSTRAAARLPCASRESTGPAAADDRPAERHLVQGRRQPSTSGRSSSSALEMCDGVQKRAAELLQVKPTTLNEMMKRLNISSREPGRVIG